MESPSLEAEPSGDNELQDKAVTKNDLGPYLEISLLGEFSLRDREKVISLDTGTHQLLLAYLIFNTQITHSRRLLAYKIWPDSNESQAHTNLRKALHKLRQTLPNVDSFIAANRQTVQWRPDAPCVVDVWEFEAAIAQSEQNDSPIDQQASLEQGIGVYSGDFMPGHYNDWILSTAKNCVIGIKAA